MSENETKPKGQVAVFNDWLGRLKPQMQLALPKHLNSERMARLVLSQYSASTNLQKCDAPSVAQSILQACALGLEPGVGGQGWLIPYYDTKAKRHRCQFVPGWRGLVDIAQRSGRASVWTEAVRESDEFSFGLGARPHLEHVRGEEDDSPITHFYAVGWVRDAQWPIIEVWSIGKVRNHLNKFNKVGEKHYALKDANNFEMYGRKVALLQCLKYLPCSIEMSNAMAVSNAVDQGRDANMTIDGDFAFVADDYDDDDQRDSSSGEQSEVTEVFMATADFKAKEAEWRGLVESGKRKPNDLIAMIESKGVKLSNDQKIEVASWLKQ